MPAQISAPKGVMEYLPPESAQFLAVRDALSAPATAAGYGYVELPVFESTELFVRGVGESTDVVSKEMYTFDDRGGRSLSLRPVVLPLADDTIVHPGHGPLTTVARERAYNPFLADLT